MKYNVYEIVLPVKASEKIEFLSKIAEECGVPNPVGAAATVVNRLLNTGVRGVTIKYGSDWGNVLKSIGPKTAAHWKRQFEAGYSLKKKVVFSS
jgi:hypothetical protein